MASVDEDALQRERLHTWNRVLTTPFPVAQTPREVIWTLNKAKLYRYVPVVPEERRHRVPLLLVFALINRPTIFDLRPGNSFVEYMVNAGFDVYLVDWGSPGPEDKDLTFDDYVLEYLPRAVRRVKAVSGAEEISLLGWCIGAILATLYASLRPDGIRNLILLTPPMDFADKSCGGLIRWIEEQAFEVDAVLQAFGNMPGELINYGAKALKPVENYVENLQRLWDNIDNPKAVESWHAMHTWANDVIPMAGAAFRQLIVQLYRENRLVEGTLALRGDPVELCRVQANFLEVIAERDHIVPPCQSGRIVEPIGSRDKDVWTIPGGHIGMMAGSQAVKNTWPHIEAWLADRSR